MQENEYTMPFVSLTRLDLALGALAMNFVDLSTQVPEMTARYMQRYYSCLES
jgi:hypothetical protein